MLSPGRRPARGKMPRGFLVKRSRRPGGSYRLRRQERDLPPPAHVPPGPEPPPAGPTGPPLPTAALPLSPEPAAAPEGPAAWGAGPLRKAFPARCLSPPAPAAPFPPGPRLPPAPPRTPLPAPPPAAPLCTPLKRPVRAKAPAKKPKALRKLSFADEVTTSPVLGLRIKAEGPEGRAGPPLAGGRSPLGEFICQLCKEHYADPLALAQHRCSRIVRVEYRCPECHKLFSCPANLASHRRWHKPRPPPAPKPPAAPCPSAGKENSSEPRPAAAQGPPEPPQHPSAADSSRGRDLKAAGQSAGAGGGADGPGLREAGPIPGAGELFACPYCHKRFRRQAYLRKHLGTHEAARPAAYSPLERGQPGFPCHLCGAHFPSADIRDKHRLWHAVREELLLPGAPAESGAAEGEPQIFSCKHCPATFFSSPGLGRHVNKCHPAEPRQVLLLQMAVRPGC
ncbi:insulinoma-associated protein 2 [Carettochelys insculpta]|uniref:insulinoma-associated protein 2 n=1 Tax=Carettochelys insculpta TaxID=44489 RepID=UPI003EC151E1